jgi:hypothetical protein
MEILSNFNLFFITGFINSFTNKLLSDKKLSFISLIILSILSFELYLNINHFEIFISILEDE